MPGHAGGRRGHAVLSSKWSADTWAPQYWTGLSTTARPLSTTEDSRPWSVIWGERCLIISKARNCFVLTAANARVLILKIDNTRTRMRICFDNQLFHYRLTCLLSTIQHKNIAKLEYEQSTTNNFVSHIQCTHSTVPICSTSLTFFFQILSTKCSKYVSHHNFKRWWLCLVLFSQIHWHSLPLLSVITHSPVTSDSPVFAYM